MSEPARAQSGAHRSAGTTGRAGRWRNLLLVAMLVGAFGWVAPTAQADVSPAAVIPTTTTLSAPATGVLGDQILLTATVTPSGATGTVDFFEDGQPTTPCQDVPVTADGTAECQTRTLGIATYEFRADFHGDGEYADSSGSATTVIGRAPTSIEYTGSLSGTVGEPLRIEAVLSVAGGEILHGYLVVFHSGETSLCSPIESPDGSHWCYWTPTETGTTTVTVIFAPGDFGSYEPASTDAIIRVTDTPQQTATTTTLNAPTTVEIGNPVTLTATVTPNPGAGTVDFSGDGTSACSDVSVAADGTATCVVDGLAIGGHTFTAAFGGTDTWLPSESASVGTEVTKVATVLSYTGATTGTVDSPMDIAASLSTAVAGDPVGPGASVSFSVDGQAVCQAETDSAGDVRCQWTPADVGPVTMTASYAGSDVYLRSTGSAPVSVDRRASTVTVTASPTAAPWSDPIVITADVPDGATGTVEFRTGGTTIAGCAAVPINAASAHCPVSSLDVGSHTVTAEYSGDADHADGSGSTDVTVTKRPTTVGYNGVATGTVGAHLAVSARVLDEATAVPRDGAAVTFELDGSSCQATTSEDGTASCELSPSRAGTRTVNVSVAADTHHAADATTARVELEAADTHVTLQAPVSIDVSLPATITAVVAPADGGTVGFSAGPESIAGCTNVPLTETAGEWSAECVTDALPVGGVTVTAAFSGTESYSPATGSTQITVNKAPTGLDYTGARQAVVAAPLEVSATVTNVVGGGSEPIPGQPVTFALADHSCTADTDDSGRAECVLTPTRADPAGSLTIEFAGTQTQSAASSSATVAVSPAPTTVTLTAPEQATYSAPVTLSATVGPGNGEGTIDFAVADKPLSGCTAIAPELVDSAWQATCITTELAVGDASVSAAYSGTDDYLSSFDTAMVAVSPAATALEYTGPTTTTVGQDSEFGVRLSNLANAGAAAGLPVTFGWGEWTCTATTDDQGLAGCTSTPSTVDQAGTLTIQFAGTTEFLAAATTAEIAVTPAATSLTYTGPTSATAGVPFSVSAELGVVADDPGQDSSGTVSAADDAPRLLGARALALGAAPAPLSVAGIAIVFSAGSQQCISRTDDSGRATCSLTLDAAGAVTLTAASAATDQLAAAQVQTSLDIAAAPTTSTPTEQTSTGSSTEQTPTDRTSSTAAATTNEDTDPAVSTATTRASATTGTAAATAVPVAASPADPTADPQLATTGFGAAPVLGAGLILLVAGALLLVVAQRRRHAREH